MKKNYVGIARDHSGSMSGFAGLAMQDYNSLIADLHKASETHKIDTIVNTVSFGIDSGVKLEVVNSSVHAVSPLTVYKADGQTPLYDAVGKLIDTLQCVLDVNDPEVTFLVMVVTDGAENHSRVWSARKLADKIAELQRTDRWTFTFRTPRGYADRLARDLGIPIGNVVDWEQSDRGLQESTVATRAAVTNFYNRRASGVMRSTSFYADLSNVSASDVKCALVEVSAEIEQRGVVGLGPNNLQWQIRPFCERSFGEFQLGRAFYQLVKNEKEVQAGKLILVRHRVSGKIYAGQNARTMLGLPVIGTVRLNPGTHGDWDIFIQSTSVNRNLPVGTDVLYWRKVREL